ncbi:MAG: hypothetical protein ACMG6S_33250 [Byssovorax sp.]
MTLRGDLDADLDPRSPFISIAEPDLHPESSFTTIPDPDLHPRSSFTTIPDPDLHPRSSFTTIPDPDLHPDHPSPRQRRQQAAIVHRKSFSCFYSLNINSLHS